METAETFLSRAIGLIGRRSPPEGGLLIEKCNAIHTFFMRFPICAKFLDGNGEVVKEVRNVPPWRLLVWGGWRAKKVLETAADPYAPPVPLVWPKMALAILFLGAFFVAIRPNAVSSVPAAGEAAPSAAPAVSRISWPQMGTIARVQSKEGNHRTLQSAVVAARPVFDDVERRLSFWKKDSELSRGVISPEMKPCYDFARKLCEQSGGAFNPFWRGKGVWDLGGVAKGFAVDLAAAALATNAAFARPGGSECGGLLVDLGGNLKAVGGNWVTGVRDPANPGGVVRSLVLSNGMACATSGLYERGKHIYDGRTGKPVEPDVASVTVLHPSSAMVADGLSTTLFVLGRKEGEAFLRRHYPEAVAIWVAD